MRTDDLAEELRAHAHEVMTTGGLACRGCACAGHAGTVGG